MKKILLVTLSLMLVASVSYAQAQKQPAEIKKIKGPLIDKTQGKIQSIEKSQKVKGDLGRFSVLVDNGKVKEFQLLAKTSFYSASSAPIVFADLKKGDKVLVLSVKTLSGDNDVITVTQKK